MTLGQTLTAFVSAFALTTLGFSAPAFAAPMEIEDIGKIQNAGNLTIAPDGETIAYTVSKYPDLLQGESDGGSSSQLYVLRPDADAPVLYTSSGSVRALAITLSQMMVRAFTLWLGKKMPINPS